MPLWNYAINQGGPDPDYVYSTAEIDPLGVYEISGYRGTSRFVEITQQSFDMMHPSDMEQGSPVPTINDLDDLELDDNGSFTVVLSAERPAGYRGDWWELHPGARRLLMRKCACDWEREIDARVAISRVDDAGADMSPEEIARRFSDMAAWIEGMIGFDMALVRYYRDHHGVNTILRSSKIDSMGGLPKQAYYDGIHEIDDDEALVLETELPKECRYWQALVGDDRFCTDSDGKFRAVISRLDPGVPNWLDKADYPWGIIQMRWNRASDYPDPTIKKVALSEVRNHLPDDTPVVTPAQRRADLRRRRDSAQLRRIW
jgi:hypothetical protein